MSLSDLLLSATAVVFGTLFFVIGISYIVYRIKRRSPFQIRS